MADQEISSSDSPLVRMAQAAAAGLANQTLLLPVVSAAVNDEGIEYEFPILEVGNQTYLPLYSSESRFRAFVSQEASFIRPSAADLCRFIGTGSGIVVDPGSEEPVEISAEDLRTLAAEIGSSLPKA
jgi:hypothetical protein